MICHVTGNHWCEKRWENAARPRALTVEKYGAFGGLMPLPPPLRGHLFRRWWEGRCGHRPLRGAGGRTNKFSDHPRKGGIEKFRTIRGLVPTGERGGGWWKDGTPQGEGTSSGAARHLPQRGRHWGGALVERAGVGTGPYGGLVEGRINFPITPVKGGSKNFGPSGGLVPTGSGAVFQSPEAP